ncbi:alkB -like protein 7 [Chelydra serpentina]|uniref:AlkB -like protein 7 n=1 Tax=Chelydra serpentina TaxID=8475 RepID=A0A8T1SNQ1_CHESE|nr:alkB -like protein 7 [Chelydra serpentina]
MHRASPIFLRSAQAPRGPAHNAPRRGPPAPGLARRPAPRCGRLAPAGPVRGGRGAGAGLGPGRGAAAAGPGGGAARLPQRPRGGGAGPRGGAAAAPPPAIHGFRETEIAQWSEESREILQRVRDMAFPPGVSQLSLVHVLDLDKTGYIKPHIDSVKFCGCTIAGLSLLSSSVMRLVSEQNPEDWMDLFLPRRSLYILREAEVASHHLRDRRPGLRQRDTV